MDKVNSIIPVVVITYNRADLLDNLLSCLQRDNVPLLYIFSDSAKSDEDEKNVQEVRDTIRAKANWCETYIFHSEKNLGLGESVKNGISTVLKEYESLIMFEDDLECVEGTYQFMSSCLRYYHNNEQVTSITGWTHPMITPDNIREDAYFDGKAECWAVGLWKRSWEGMEMEVMDIFNKCIEKGIDVKKYGSDMPIMAEESKRKNRWAVHFWYNQILKGGLCLRPVHSLVEHFGWDSRATTTTPKMMRWQNPPLKNSPNLPIQFPTEIAEHPDCPTLWKKAIGY